MGVILQTFAATLFSFTLFSASLHGGASAFERKDSKKNRTTGHCQMLYKWSQRTGSELCVTRTEGKGHGGSVL